MSDAAPSHPEGKTSSGGHGLSEVAAAPLPRAFYARDVLEVAPELLNKVLVVAEGDAARRSGRIVEVEAYRGRDDPASHSARGLTPRNQVMFGPPGHLYVYFTYGMHWCANAVCEPEGSGAAVLLRALAPLDGVEEMRADRPAARRDRDLCNGPAKLCQALGLAGDFNGADLVGVDRGVAMYDDGTPPPTDPHQTTRIGITNGTEHPWRWYIEGDPNVSRR